MSRAASPAVLTALRVRAFSLPSCPKCNDTPCGPVVSQHVSHELIRYLWSCEACGYEFDTRVEFGSGGLVP